MLMACFVEVNIVSMETSKEIVKIAGNVEVLVVSNAFQILQ